MKLVKDILKNIGVRPPGSKNEQNTAKLIQKEFSKHCNEVHVENFYCTPGSHYFWIHVSNILFVFGLITYFTNPFITSVFIGLSYLNFFVHRIFNIDLYRFMFEKKISQNIIGKIPSKKKTKKTIIFTAHHDSGKISKLMNWKHGIYLIYLDILFACISIIILAINFFININSLFLFSVLLIKFIFAIIVTKTLYTKKFSLGANDNLTSVQLLVNISKKIKQQENTEIRFISFGAEELGCLGSSNYVNKHLKELKNTIVINFESIASGNYFGFMDSERIFTKYNKKLNLNLKKLLNKNKGKLFKKTVGNLGISDAGPFAKHKIPAATIIAINKEGQIPNWHSKHDTFENINEYNLKILEKTVVEFINNY
jgi:hypothetical protein